MVLVAQSVIERQVFGELVIVLREGSVMLRSCESAARQAGGDAAVVRITQEKGGNRSGVAGTEQRTHYRSIKGVLAFQRVIINGVEKGVEPPIIGTELYGVFSLRPGQC